MSRAAPRDLGAVPAPRLSPRWGAGPRGDPPWPFQAGSLQEGLPSGGGPASRGPRPPGPTSGGLGGRAGLLGGWGRGGSRCGWETSTERAPGRASPSSSSATSTSAFSSDSKTSMDKSAALFCYRHGKGQRPSEARLRPVSRRQAGAGRRLGLWGDRDPANLRRRRRRSRRPRRGAGAQPQPAPPAYLAVAEEEQGSGAHELAGLGVLALRHVPAAERAAVRARSARLPAARSRLGRLNTKDPRARKQTPYTASVRHSHLRRGRAELGLGSWGAA